MLPPVELLKRLNAQAPGFEANAMIIERPGDKVAVARFEGREPGYVMDSKYSEVLLSAVTGEVVNDGLRPSRQSPWWRTTMTIVGLHYGQYVGAFMAWAYFVLGLAGAWLFYSGNLLWIETRRKKARKGGEVEQSRATRLMGSATVGVCLGCVAGISLTSLLALLNPGLGMWAHDSAAATGVDLVAFIGALSFGWMAIATKLRIAAGLADSIWSAGVSGLRGREFAKSG